MTIEILLAEDNPRDVEIALDVLARGGEDVEVIVVGDGEEALDYLRRKRKFRLRRAGLPSLVLLDVKMPKLGGFDVLRQMRADRALDALPVIMLTASRQEQDLMSAFELEADAYVMKPLTWPHFDAAVRTARASAAARAGRT